MLIAKRLAVARDPLLDASVVDALDARESGTDERDAPRRLGADVGAERVARHARGGVPRRRHAQAAERRPEHRRGRNEAAHEIGPGDRELVADELCPAAAEAALEKEVHARTVGRHDARNAFAVRRESFLLLVLPVKEDATRATRQLSRRESHERCRRAGERARARRARA